MRNFKVIKEKEEVVSLDLTELRGSLLQTNEIVLKFKKMFPNIKYWEQSPEKLVGFQYQYNIVYCI
jgi:hypothetical protein